MLRIECVTTAVNEEIAVKLVGELLTLIDMSGLDREAKKAFKDMTRQAVYRVCNSALVVIGQINKQEKQND